MLVLHGHRNFSEHVYLLCQEGIFGIRDKIPTSVRVLVIPPPPYPY